MLIIPGGAITDHVQSDFVYLFLDEGGNLDFSPNGTRFFTLTCLTKKRPFAAYRHLSDLKYDLIEQGIGIDRFHATEDRQHVRNQVFEIIRGHLDGVRVDSIIVEKKKTGPSLRCVEKFYPMMLGYLLRYVIEGQDRSSFKEVIVITDSLPLKKKEEAIKKGIKETLGRRLPGVKYRIFHHESKSNLDLQIVDYFNWAIYRKWNDGDCRSYDLIKSVVRTEFDIFRNGTMVWY
jgi:hypothetical protein